MTNKTQTPSVFGKSVEDITRLLVPGIGNPRVKIRALPVYNEIVALCKQYGVHDNFITPTEHALGINTSGLNTEDRIELHNILHAIAHEKRLDRSLNYLEAGRYNIMLSTRTE